MGRFQGAFMTSLLGIIEDDNKPRWNWERSSCPPALTTASPGVNTLAARLMVLLNQLESALVLLWTLQAQYTAMQTTISALKQKVSQLETLICASTATPPPEVWTQGLDSNANGVGKSVEGQWTTVHEEWASKRERLVSACGEWESKVKSAEFNFSVIFSVSYLLL